MKLVLTSADLLLTSKSKVDYEHTIKVLEALDNKDCMIVFTSSQATKLKELPDNFNKLLINRSTKMSSDRGLIDKVLEKTPYDSPKDIIVLGANDSDCIMAFNHKLLLFTAHWLEETPRNKKIFQYGIGLKSPDSLTMLIDNFLKMTENPWYYKVQVSNSTTMYSLISANTGSEPMSADQVELINTFRQYLKHGVGDNRVHLLAYFMVSCHYNLNELRNVDYIGIYPSSSSTGNPDLEYFKETLRLQHKIRFNDPLLIRHTKVPKRHFKKREDRLRDGCSSQFDSIIVNPKLSGNLKGKTVCIIDDFTTYGTSCETVRHLFEHEKVDSIIFLTLGKFGKSYYKYDYNLVGDVYSKYSYKEQNGYTYVAGEFNENDSSTELVKRLGHILK